MADMEVHEHVVLDATAKGQDRQPATSHCSTTMWNRSRATSRSTMSIRIGKRAFGLRVRRMREICRLLVWNAGAAPPLAAKKFFAVPGSPVLFFLYKYIFSFGFLDGIPA